MFVYSFKATRRQIFSMILCVIMLIAVVVVAILWPVGGASAAAWKPAAGGSEDERVAFLTRLGYEVEASQASVREVLIPDSFDEVFGKYNQIQKDAGMDLTPYQGKRVKCWTYRILNVPDQGEVVANLYVYKEKIVGGDISSAALDGFMHGLVKNEQNGAAVPTAASGSDSAAAPTAAAEGTAAQAAGQ